MANAYTIKNRTTVSIALAVMLVLTAAVVLPITVSAAGTEPSLVSSSNCADLGLDSSYVGYYAIENADELLWFADYVNNTSNSINGVLLNDIDLMSVTTWTFMKSYYGIFDGRGYSIVGLSKNSSIANEHHYGFTNNLYGTVKNVVFDNAYVDTQSESGNGIIAYNNYGKISGCMVVNSSILLGNYAGLGLIAGKNLSGGVIENCGVANSEIGRRYSGWDKHTLGGITQVNDGTVDSCYTYNITISNGTSANGALISSGNEPVNSYYYTTSATVDTYGTALPADDFNNGTVAVRLGSAYGQDIDTWNVPDEYPVVGGAALYEIYYCHDDSLSAGYSNTNGAEGHTYSDVGFCDYCDSYQPGTRVTNSNYGDLSLTADHAGYWALGNAGQLYWFSAVTNGDYNNKTQNASVNIALSNSITVNGDVLDDEGNLNSGTYREWKPIGKSSSYAGTFDGNGMEISGIYLPSQHGLFEKTTSEAVIKNAGVTDSYINGDSSYNGGIVGENNGTVMNCYYKGVVGGSSYIGGITGINNGTVTGCYYAGSIKTDAYYSGGVVGLNHGSIVNCYNTGSAPAGIAGLNDGGSIKNCYSTGTASSGITRAGTNGGTVANCYYLGSSASGGIGSSAVAGQAEAKTAAQFASGEVAYLLQQGNTEQVWGQNIDNGSTVENIPAFSASAVYAKWYCDGDFADFSNTAYTVTTEHLDDVDYYDNGFCMHCDAYQAATLISSGNYAIGNAGQLCWFAQHVGEGNNTSNAVVTANINAAVTQCKYLGIGTEDYPYAGNFNGGKYTITLALEADNTDATALFDFIGGAGIHDLHTTGTIYVPAPTTTGMNKFAAGVVSRVISGDNTIERVTSDIVITSEINGDGTHGGFVGVIESVASLTLNNCGFSGAINGANTSHCGGLIGWNNSADLVITNCYQAGSFYLKDEYNDTINRNTQAKTFTNVYYLNALGTVQGSQMSADAFASGEVAYLLQQGNAEQVWGQRIGVDAVPMLSDVAVYKSLYCDDVFIGYTNTYGDPVHVWNHDAPVFAWNEEYTLLTVTLSCTRDDTHTLSDTTAEISVDTTTDPNYIYYTGTVVLDSRAHTDTAEVFNEIISVYITWTDLSFTYTIVWNSETLQYEGAGWSASVENGGVITVTNEGNIDVNVSFEYSSLVATVNGSFTDAENANAVTSPVLLAVGEKKKIRLTLYGEPSGTFESATLGTVTVIVSKADTTSLP